MSLLYSKKYTSVSQKDTIEGCFDIEEGTPSSPETVREEELGSAVKHLPFSLWTRWIPWLLCLCLLLSNIHTWIKLKRSVFNDPVYSPADSVIEYKNVVFTAAVQDEISEFQGVPNAKNNRLWDGLFNLGVSRISIEDAKQLMNKSSPIDNDGNYAVTLDVFHQLHCLNKIRQKIYWNTTNYGEPEPIFMNTVHIDHCIDQLRQSLMCTADVSPIPYQWYDSLDSYMPATGSVHTCRNFEAIHKWAKGRVITDWDLTIKLNNPLGNVTHKYSEQWCKDNDC